MSATLFAFRATRNSAVPATVGRLISGTISCVVSKEPTMTFLVNIFKGISGESLEIVCSAWPDNIEISKLCIRKGTNSSPSSYGGPEFESVAL
ncbi:hypothetical protein DY000_02023547 [Brassica cretica]|uniref:Uncharacterized protein n=1 Tax=Brassica cretica TaxID=69181 RepID=A0ABQ7E883_BRACR|nr:hypothetical protein DY000_02023547 [Brassica cretica]